MAGHCPNPNCGKRLGSANLEPITIKAGSSKSWHGAQYLCPYCRTILSVAIDPVALNDDLVHQIKKIFRMG